MLLHEIKFFHSAAWREVSENGTFSEMEATQVSSTKDAVAQSSDVACHVIEVANVPVVIQVN